MKFRIIIGAVLLAAAPGCGLTDPARDLEFTLGTPEGHPLRDEALVVEWTDASIEVTGVIMTPDPCQRIDASLERQADLGVLRIVASSTGSGGCPDVVVMYPYHAVIRPAIGEAPARLRVVHAYRQANWSEVIVLDTTRASQ